ncbi:hypothetical protein ABZX95_40195 [Streptomyces sp. NPDC004232]|uniref:hypothetical protein n=1 Tax=Streptomyces sp. NPDC004232 TaxID=3154454 RepID=UPI0033A0D81E
MNRTDEPLPSAADTPSSEAHEPATPTAQYQDGGRDRTTGSRPEKTAVRPAAKQTSHKNSHPQAELDALEMLVSGMPQHHVQLRTRLSRSQIRNLAKIVTEEAANPAEPRNVIRAPPPGPPARIREMRPH